MVMSIRVGERQIGPYHPCFIIAEAGVNHNGDLDLAIELVRQAKRCGADCVKFQTFSAERVITRTAPKADYQLKLTDATESQFDMLRKLELKPAAHRQVLKVCQEEGILFLSTPYSLEDAQFLIDLGSPALKLASMHLVETPFLSDVARFNVPLILSTGMATLAEVDQALSCLRESGHYNQILLQCTTNYPSAAHDANLRAMLSMAHALDVLTGYSDHTEGISVALAAVALGACVLEKHFTLNRSLAGPDHSCSSDPQEFETMVYETRRVEAALGSAVKRPVPAERLNAVAMRRSITSKVAIPEGEVFTADQLTFKRPGTGISPSRLSEVLGRIAACSIPADETLRSHHIR